MLSPSVGMLQVRLPAYEGPLDLLLRLIRENRVDIYDIPIAQIARQYLDQLARWEAADLAVAGEYLVMAATLLEIKSRLLLPQAPAADPEQGEDDPRAELVQRLLEYERYQGMVETLRGWEELRSRLHFRGAQENPDDYLLPVPEGALDADGLLSALSRVLRSAGLRDEAVTAVVPRRRVSLRMKMAAILRLVRAHPEGMPFEALFADQNRLYDIVLAFLALLELLRHGQVTASQETSGAGIVVRGGGAEPQ